MVKLSLAVLIVGFLCVGSETRAFSRKSAEQAPADASVWVMRGDGAQSCSPKSGKSLDDGAQELKKARVRVLESRKGNDGNLHMQMCGAPSGSTNAYLIPKDDLSQAIALGYVIAK